jgi:hypothetical protein
MFIKPEHPNKLIDIFSEDEHDEPIDSNYKPPINQFIESVYKLGLNLSNDLTEEIINEDKTEPEFKISVKETAWQYLINSLRFRKK